MNLRNKGIKKEILLEIEAGATREVLNKKYNKGTVTKVYNEYLLDMSKTEVKEETIEELFKKIFNIVDRESEYEITIKINKKVKQKNKLNFKSLNEKEEILVNPYDIYYRNGKQELINELKSKEIEYLIRLIKKYFADTVGKIYKEKDKSNIIEYIVNSLERLLNIGQSFRY